MKGNLKKAMIMLVSLGFMFGLALGKIHENHRQEKDTHHSKIIIYQSHDAKVQASQLREEMRLRLEEKLQRVHELQIKAMEEAERAQKIRFKYKCK